MEDILLDGFSLLDRDVNTRLPYSELAEDLQKKRVCNKCSISDPNECYICESFKRKGEIDSFDLTLSQFNHLLDKEINYNRVNFIHNYKTKTLNNISLTDDINNNSINQFIKLINADAISSCIIKIINNTLSPSGERLVINKHILINFTINNICLSISIRFINNTRNITNRILEHLIIPCILNGLSPRTVIISDVGTFNLYTNNFGLIINAIDYRELDMEYKDKIKNESMFRLFAKLYTAFHCYKNHHRVSLKSKCFIEYYQSLINMTLEILKTHKHGNSNELSSIMLTRRYYKNEYWLCIPMLLTKFIYGINPVDILIDIEGKIAIVKGDAAIEAERLLSNWYQIEFREDSGAQYQYFSKCITFERADCF